MVEIAEMFENLSRSQKLVLLSVLVGSGGALAYWLHKKQSSALSIGRADLKGSDPPLKLKKRVKRKNREIIVVSHRVDWTRSYSYIAAALDECKVLGFDCEWITENKKVKPVALVQLSTQHGVCILFRLCMLSSSMPQSFKDLLENKSVLKVGVGAVEDGKKLMKDFGINVRGCVDLRYLVVRQGRKYLGGLSLRDIAHDVLDVELEKSSSIRCGDWEARELSQEQINYAADDAIVAVDVFSTIVANKLTRKSFVNHLLEYYACPFAEDLDEENEEIIEDFNKKALSVCQGIVDVNFTQSSASSSRTAGRVSDHLVVSFCALSWPEVDPAVKNGSESQKGKVAYRSYSTRKSPLYHNCQLRAPDGQLLCTCDEKKARWYLEKGLADKLSEDPLTVKLRFEPGGRPESLKNYYLQEKTNICVVCGKADSYIRKNVVPHEYRKFFPPIMKDHLSHDVLLLCVGCHQACSCYDNRLREYYAQLCDAPIHKGSNIKSFSDPHMKKIQSSARALVKSKRMLPDDRRHELEENIKNFFGVSEIDDEVLKRAFNIDTRVINEDFFPHGEKVVEYMIEKGALMDFEKTWRQHFLDTMKPLHLPPMWSVDHNHERLANMEMKG